MKSYMDKIKNIPSVNYTSLIESHERRAFMEYQFKLYGIQKHFCYQVARYDKTKNNFILEGPVDGVNCIGSTISHLNMMREWYVNTTEEMAIFCEDDHSFESIKYWNFTWDDFINNLPEDWECVQLARIEHDAVEEYPNKWGSELKLLPGRWWNAAALMKREYVAKVLQTHTSGFNKYHFYIDEYNFPLIENVLYLGKGRVYNIPLFFENHDLTSTYKVYWKDYHPNYEQNRNYHKVSTEHFLNLWKTEGIYKTIEDIMGKTNG